MKADYLRKGKVLQGYVHDESAAFMGGVSGNAGLFSTARDVAKVYQLLIDGGVYNGKRYLSRETCDLFLTHTSKISRRGLGFDKPDVNNLVFVFLSNRIYPRPFDHKQLMRLNIRPRMQQVMYQALMK